VTFNPAHYIQHLRAKKSTYSGCHQAASPVTTQVVTPKPLQSLDKPPKNETVTTCTAFGDLKNQKTEQMNVSSFFEPTQKSNPQKAVQVVTVAQNGDLYNDSIDLPVTTSWCGLVTSGDTETALARLCMECPEYVPAEAWRQSVADGQQFMRDWGECAVELGWTAADLFGLHDPPMEPHPSYSRMSRVDCMGLIWMLKGDPVVEIHRDRALIRRRTTGSMNTYYRSIGEVNGGG
jgi:hypothetical protein